MRVYKVVLQETKGEDHWNNDNSLLVVAANYENVENKIKSFRPDKTILSIVVCGEVINKNQKQLTDIYQLRGHF